MRFLNMAAAPAAVKATEDVARSTPERSTWRNFIETAPAHYWLFPNLSGEMQTQPDNDALLESYRDAAIFLGISESTLRTHEERLRIPHLILTPSPVIVGQFVSEYADAKTANQLRRAIPYFTTHSLTWWTVLNDCYSPERVTSAPPGAYRWGPSNRFAPGDAK